MTDRVDELLKGWRKSAFAWGETDCFLSVGSYLATQGGADLTPEFRGQYATAEAAAERVAAAGGGMAIIDASGLSRTAQPARGDIVLLDIGYGVAGVHTGDSVAVRLERGVLEINKRFVKILAAWSVPHV